MDHEFQENLGTFIFKNSWTMIFKNSWTMIFKNLMNHVFSVFIFLCDIFLIFCKPLQS
jgi:hypothetical protein